MASGSFAGFRNGSDPLGLYSSEQDSRAEATVFLPCNLHTCPWASWSWDRVEVTPDPCARKNPGGHTASFANCGVLEMEETTVNMPLERAAERREATQERERSSQGLGALCCQNILRGRTEGTRVERNSKGWLLWPLGQQVWGLRLHFQDLFLLVSSVLTKGWSSLSIPISSPPLLREEWEEGKNKHLCSQFCPKCVCRHMTERANTHLPSRLHGIFLFTGDAQRLLCSWIPGATLFCPLAFNMSKWMHEYRAPGLWTSAFPWFGSVSPLHPIAISAALVAWKKSHCWYK